MVLYCVIVGPTLADPHRAITVSRSTGAIERKVPFPRYGSSWTRADDRVFIHAFGERVGSIWELVDGAEQATKLFDVR